MAECAEPERARAHAGGGGAQGGGVISGGGNQRRNDRPPYDLIATLLRTGHVVPFLGAGASVFECLKGAFDADNTVRPPTAEELAEFLAREGSFPDDSAPERRKDLALVAYYVQLVTGGDIGLRALMRKKFLPQFEPNSLHRLLVRIAKEKPLLIITTNYDDMLEKEFDHHKRSPENPRYHLIVTNVDNTERPGSVQYKRPGQNSFAWLKPKELPVLSPDDASIIYKMHGSINRYDNNQDGYVITEEHYTRFLGSVGTAQYPVPPMLIRIMQS